MTCRYPLLSEVLRNRGDELQQGQPGVDVRCALAGLLHQRGNVIAGHVEQALKALRLFVGVNVHPLRVLDQLPLQGLGVVDIHDAGWHGEEFGKLRGAEPSGSRHDLEALVVGSDGDGLDEAVMPDAVGKLGQLRFIEGLTRVGGGLVDGVDGEELELAAVLHNGALLWARVDVRGGWSERHKAVRPWGEKRVSWPEPIRVLPRSAPLRGRESRWPKG